MAEAVRKARSVPGSFVWLGLHEPTYDEFDDLALYFAPHPLAIEDAVNAHQRVGAGNPVTSCDLHVFVDEAAEPVSS